MSKPQPRPSQRGEFIETETGNKISRRATILGPKHIILAGKCVVSHDVVIRGDLVRPATTTITTGSATKESGATTGNGEANKDLAKPAAQGPSSSQSQTSIHLARHVFLSPGVVLHPPSRLSHSTNTTTPSTTPTTTTTTYYPLLMSPSTFIGPQTTIRAASIGSNVHIGANCVVGNMVIIKDNVRVLDGTILPQGSVWGAGVVVGGRPGRVVGDVGEGWAASSGVAGGGGDGKVGGLGDEGVGTRVRERWGAVGNKR